MLGTKKIKIQKPIQSGRKSRIIGDYMIFMEMFGNGAKMVGTETMKMRQRTEVVGMILKDL